MSVPELRVEVCNEAPFRPDREWVLYWMIANRRVRWNFALQQAIAQARRLGKPLVVLEALRSGYRWASDRLHLFALQGMADNLERVQGKDLTWHTYVEPEPGHGAGLLEALAKRACVVVTDDFPAFFLPRMVRSAAKRLDVRVEQVDSNGLLPMRVANHAYPTAFSFRAFLQKELPPHLDEAPVPDPLASLSLPRLKRLPDEILRRWPRASDELLAGDSKALARLSIDHSVKPVALKGGAQEGERRLRDFVQHRLERYGEERAHPDSDASSGLSPWLHWGHVSVHEIFDAITTRDEWTPARLKKKGGGKREGWWGMSPEAEAFLDELVTWRELGFNMCSQREDYDSLDTLPAWAQRTLAQHEKDPRPQLYSYDELAEARTGDEVWNAAQRQLVEEGRLHNYLRMLWGKKVLEWTPNPREAYRILEELNNRYALDGRDPNSYSGILWIFGRYDRAWGPERPIFGTVRYMSSENTKKKLHMKRYLERFGPTPSLL